MRVPQSCLALPGGISLAKPTDKKGRQSMCLWKASGMKGMTPRAVSDEDSGSRVDWQTLEVFKIAPPSHSHSCCRICLAEGDLREAVLLHDQRRLQDP